MPHEKYIRKAIALAHQAIQTKVGGPFGALIVKDDQIIGQSSNTVYRDHDPTAHAEVQAIRDACKNLGQRSLEGCILYTSCEPCPMCYGAVHYAKIEKVYYAVTHETADEIAGFGVKEIYENLAKPIEARQPKHVQVLGNEGRTPFETWTKRK
ncbi:MAG: nucleoside deaminase [Bacteroidota bacterium]